jgi:hypothetical protein
MSSGRAAMVLGALVLAFAACSAAPATDPASVPRFLTQLTASPTPLATAVAASTKPKATAKPKATPKPTAKPKATPKPTSYYKPPGWDGYSDVDCPDLKTHAHAQSFFIGTGGSTTSDPYRLDANHDGSACETLP